jgi:hypothetical protein
MQARRVTAGATFEQFQRLSKHRVLEEGKAGDIAARTRQARNEALPDRIIDQHKDDRD